MIGTSTPTSRLATGNALGIGGLGGFVAKGVASVSTYWKNGGRGYSSPPPSWPRKRDLVSLALPTEADIVKE